MAMSAIQESAEKNGLSEMTLDEINAEIAEARRSEEDLGKIGDIIL